MVHRPEIDGLRALAVLPVILFHAGFGLFGGGYVGVDVFFVISGFLITTIIVSELRAGTFSIVRFYERRARRILPALFFVMAACLPAAWLWLLPHEAVAFGKSLVAVSVFLSNVLFWRTSGYFDLAADEKPLLHTWSLGVEEQFYIVFPLLVAWCWHFGVRRLAMLLLGLAGISLLASQWALDRSADASFFLAPFRAWELLAGALLALAGGQHWVDSRNAALPVWAREALGLLALGLIIVPVFGYGAATPFPGVRALPPVLGTVLALVFIKPNTAAGRLLTLRPVLWLGMISYSAYLWHQPLLAFARLAQVGMPSPAASAGVAALSLVLGHLSWRYVEAPFRTGSRWSRRAIFVGSAVSTLAFIGIGAALVASHGLAQRWPAQVRQLIDPPKTRIEGCPAMDHWLHVCRIGQAGRTGQIVLLGDSHAYAIASALDEHLAQAGKAGYVVHTACHPIAGIFDSREPTTPARVAYCAEAQRRLLAFVDQPGITGVLVAIRWTARLYPMDSEIDAPAFDNHEGGIERDLPFRRNLAMAGDGRMTEAAPAKARALADYLASLAALKPTVVLDPVPEVGWMPPRLNLLAMAGGGQPPDVISTRWLRYQQRNATAIRLLNADPMTQLRHSRPQALLCNSSVTARCVVQKQGALYYADDDHLSMLGARLVVDDMLSQFDAPP
ncbi:MAG: acyltransferase [Microbacteriaceae bacterium]|nr:acyltransferase [Burkholderiaceae bacterium]